jgi:hypothetical protein
MFNAFAHILGNLYNGAKGGIRSGLTAAHILRPQAKPSPPPAPAPVRPPTPSLGQFLATHIKPIDQKIISVAHPVVKAINGNPVAKGAVDLVNEGVVQPVVRGGQALTELQNTGHIKNGRQFAADAATTGLNFAGGLEAKGLIKGGQLAVRAARGALEGAGIGGAQGGVQAFANKGSAKDYAKDIAIGAGLGAAGGAAVPVVGAGGKIVIKGIKNGSQTAAKVLADESGHIGGSNLGPVKPPAPAPGVNVNVGPANPKVKLTRYASKTVPESELVSQPIREQVKAEAPGYVPENEQARLQEAAQRINEMGPDKAILDVQRRLNVPNGKISSQDVTDAHAVAAGLDARGDEGSMAQSADIYKKLSEHLTASGQTIQAAALIARRSPAGLKYQAISDLTKAGVDVTPELSAKIDAHIKDIASAPNPAARGKKVAGLSKTILKEIPQGTAKNLISVWKAGLLSGAKTQGGNFVSNATFSALHDVSNPLAAFIDQAMSLVTGKRTVPIALRGSASGFKEGIGKGINTLKTGIDERNIGADGKYEQHAEINFKNPIVQKVLGGPSNLVFRGMAAADQPFYFKQLRSSLDSLARAEANNKDLSGAAYRKYVQDFKANPPETALQTASNEANKAVLGNDTFASKIISSAKSGIDRAPFTEAGKTVAHAVIDILAPFTKVPSAFISRVVDFTPAGSLKEIGSQIAKHQFDQRAMATALSEATTGTAVLWLGTKLADANLLSGNYPKNDPQEAARWKTEHITPNSIKIGGTWQSLNYLGPLGLLFNASKLMHDARAGGADGAGGAAAAIAGLGQGLLGQSFLQGFSGFSDAIKDPERSAQTYVNSQASSIVPAWSNDIGNMTDGMQRQANSVWEAIKSRVPGARTDLAPKHDTFGNDLEQPAGGVNAALNPLKPSNDNHNPMLNELDRLDQAHQTIFPVESKTIGSGDNTIKLKPAQVADRTKRIGDQVQPLWNDIMNSPGYGALDDAHKKDALHKALTDVSSAVDVQMTKEIDPSKASKDGPTGDVAQILLGNAPTPTDYVNSAKRSAMSGGSSGSGSSSGLSPADKYTAALDKYKADKAAGRLTGIEDSKARSSLARDKVTSAYSQDVLDFYGLSKKAAAAYMAENPDDAAKLYAQARDLDAKLGGTKYKYGLGTKNGGVKKVRMPKLAGSKSVSIPKLTSLKGAKPTKLKMSTSAKVAKAGSGKKVKLTLA